MTGVSYPECIIMLIIFFYLKNRVAIGQTAPQNYSIDGGVHIRKINRS